MSEARGVPQEHVPREPAALEPVPFVPEVAHPPGWYPAAQGWFRWWDGVTWGEWRPALPATGGTDNSKTLVVLSHLGCLIGGFITPLVIYTVESRNTFVRHHAAEALNFQLTVLIAMMITVPLMFVLIGIPLFFAVIVGNYVFGIMAAVKAGRGEWYRYPVTVRMVKPSAQ